MGAKLGLVFAILVAGCGFEEGSYEDGAEPSGGGGDQPDAGIQAASCPASYTVTVAGSASQYRVPTAKITWLDAVSACASDGPHTHLVVLSSVAEGTGLAPLVDEKAWVGLSNRVADSFQWVTAERAAPVAGTPPWEHDDPDGEGMSCANLRSESGLMGDSECDESLAYICECDQLANDPSRY